MSARSKPALGWNVACRCTPIPLVTTGGDVGGPRPRPRAPGTLPLGTARPGPSLQPHAGPGAGPGRGLAPGWAGAPAAGHLPVSLRPAKPKLSLRVASSLNLLFLFFFFNLGARETLRIPGLQGVFRADVCPDLQNCSYQDLQATPLEEHTGISEAEKGQT